MKGQITFLYHSGFIYENDTYLFVFDAWRDPAHALPDRIRNTEKKVYFFATHNHRDHFSPRIGMYENEAAGYFLHTDCRLDVEHPEKVHLLEVGDTLQEEDFRVHMYGSTDIGGSYFIQGKDFSIFHAGDLNWWHWAGEGDEENQTAREAFFAELSKIKERQADVAFFSVDARQAVAREWGVTAFLQHLMPTYLVPMHAFGPTWVPTYTFRWHFPQQKVWIPQKPGDTFIGE